MKTVPLRSLEVLAPVLLLVVHGFLYNRIGEVAASRGVNYGPLLEMPADAHVPFVPLFVLPYLAVWFLPLALVGFLAWKRGGERGPFRRIAVSLLALMLGCYALWIMFPVCVDLRLPESVLAGHGVLGELVRFNYEGASHWNACPSFHVAGPWFLYRAVRDYVPRMPKVFLAVVVAIAASTVLIRIHYLLDIAGGLLVAELAIRCVLRPLERSGALAPRLHPAPPVPARISS